MRIKMQIIRRAVSTGALFACATVASGNEPVVEYVSNGRGPVPLYMPADYDGSEPLPGAQLENYFNLVEQIEEHRFLYCVPQGTTNILGHPFWNATDVCCNFTGSNVDDSGYLRGLIDLVRSQYAVDEASIHFTGLSNGGFMSYRMGCDHADIVASIAPLAGVTYENVALCSPSAPVHVLHVHGTADDTILYDGGCFGAGCYPGAEGSVDRWLGYNGCSSSGEGGGEPFDLDGYVSGNETTSTIYQSNCEDGVTVELWTLAGSGHVPGFVVGGENALQNRYAPRVVEWLLSHRKPAACLGDLDLDGLVDGTDLTVLLGSWNEQDEVLDLDDDGIIDGKDLAILLSRWGSCS